MIVVRRSEDRGRGNHGWLDSRHTFSFAGYHDPRHMRFGALRVINEDRVRPGAGFGEHEHEDMEIVSIVLDGALRHRDSMGNGSVLGRGDVQRMTAGTGVRHSEMNGSDREPVHFLQVWIHPDRRGLEPGYEERNFTDAEKEGRLLLLVSPDGRDGSLRIHQDASIHGTVLSKGGEVVHGLREGRRAWIQVARGSVTVNGERLRQGDGAAVTDVGSLTITGLERAEVVLFDLA
ncbi:MAG: pirin family protein [Planctomycetaceae bacterium]|nr:pirin family protein [Planctomycetota bacterium]NUN52077.1 pirin family protein [Planctomycetaceae bacterium]